MSQFMTKLEWLRIYSPTPDRRKENSVLVRKMDFWSSEKDMSGVMRKYISGLVRKRCLVL